ncbi:MAG: hypothetical protein QM503_03785 [Bacteroidota bacterium]
MNIIANILGSGMALSQSQQIAGDATQRVIADGGEVINPACLDARINNLLNIEFTIQAAIERVEADGGEVINQACLSSRYIALTQINLS